MKLLLVLTQFTINEINLQLMKIIFIFWCEFAVLVILKRWEGLLTEMNKFRVVNDTEVAASITIVIVQIIVVIM